MKPQELQKYLDAGWIVAKDGDVLNPVHGDKFLVLNANRVQVVRQSGGFVRGCDDSTITNEYQRGGVCEVIDYAILHCFKQSGGHAQAFYGKAMIVSTEQHGGYCRAYDKAILADSDQSGGVCEVVRC